MTESKRYASGGVVRPAGPTDDRILIAISGGYVPLVDPNYWRERRDLLDALNEHPGAPELDDPEHLIRGEN